MIHKLTKKAIYPIIVVFLINLCFLPAKVDISAQTNENRLNISQEEERQINNTNADVVNNPEQPIEGLIKSANPNNQEDQLFTLPEGEENQEEKEAFSFDQLGSKAMEQVGSKTLEAQATENGFKLNSTLQAIEGNIRNKGLSITSTAKEEKGGELKLTPNSLSRKNQDIININPQGQVSTTEDKSKVIIDRDLIQEEFLTTGDGLRQDFIIKNKPEGEENQIYLTLNIAGADFTLRDEQTVELTLKESGRVLVYNKLFVTDDNNQELPAKFIINNNKQLAIEVDDTNAIYPIRIDPTFTDDDWVGIGGVYPGANNTVRSIIFDSTGNLYAGGSFTTAGGITVNRIAKWDGTAWSALGSGMNNFVYALTLDSNNNLYAGGSFGTAGGITASRIAKWDGTAWSALGSGMNSTVFALAFDSSNTKPN